MTPEEHQKESKRLARQVTYMLTAIVFVSTFISVVAVQLIKKWIQ